jgi:hypothetical protein
MKTGVRTSIVAALLIAGAAVLLLTDLGTGAARPDRHGVLEIVMEGNEYSPSRMIIPAGEPITLRFVNNNDAARNLAAGRVPIEEDGRPVAFEEDLFAGISARAEPAGVWIGPSERVPVVTLNIPARSTATVELTFPEERAGEWELACFRGRGCEPRTAAVGRITIR